MRLAAALFCVLLAGCGDSGPPTRGTPVSFADVCGKAYDGKRVMLEGFLRFPSEFKSDEVTVMLRLKPDPETPDVVGVSAKLGNAVNNVELPPSSFRNSDLKLHTSDGQVVGYQDKVRVSGTMYYPSAIAHVEFKCGLSNTLFESAGH